MVWVYLHDGGTRAVAIVARRQEAKDMAGKHVSESVHRVFVRVAHHAQLEQCVQKARVVEPAPTARLTLGEYHIHMLGGHAFREEARCLFDHFDEVRIVDGLCVHAVAWKPAVVVDGGD
jgi:hypothetical protein